jgi:osmoprotectant transport system permease protein
MNKDSFIWWDWVGRHTTEIRLATFEHLRLTVIAVAIGFAISLPLALLARRSRLARGVITSATGVMYTIPSLALFVTLLAVTGFSTVTVEIALVSYTLLILVRNILEGLESVPASVREAADGMGLRPMQRLIAVELPLAIPTIAAGVRIATVTTVGLVTVGGLLGFGGLGSFINSGLDRFFSTEVVVGAGLSIVLAVVLDAFLVGVERLLTPWRRTRRGARVATGWQPEMPTAVGAA